MKTRFTAAIGAFSLLLPLGAIAQSGATGTTGATGTPATTSQYPSTQTETRTQAGQSSPSATRTQAEWNRTGSSQSMASQNKDFHRIKEDKLEEKMTAERLKGKDVVDRNGQKIGEVKAIGLGSSIRESSGKQDATRSASTPGTSSTASASATASAAMGSAYGMAGGDQVNVYIEVDDSVGIGGDLAAVPASSLQFDREEDHLKLNLDRQEFASRLKQGESSRSTAE